MSITEPFELKKLFARASAETTPLSGTFEITSRCNFNCKMCYIHNQNYESQELTTAQWKKIIFDSASHGTLFALLTGGEPLIRKDFKELYLTCSKLGMLVSVNTNGSLIDEEMIEFFKNNPPHRINISMYGISEETYGRLCENAAAYEKTKSVLLKLKDAGIAVKINLSISGLNSSDIEGVFEFSKKHKIPVQPSTYMFRPIRREENCVAAFERDTPENSSLYTYRCMKCQNTPEMLSEKISQVMHEVDLAEQYAASHEAYEQIKPCRAGKGAFWVSSQGHMMGCGMMPDVYSDLLAADFDTAWHQIVSQSVKLTLPKECSVCKYKSLCDICAASYKSEVGSKGAAPEYQCRRAKELYRLLVKSSTQD